MSQRGGVISSAAVAIGKAQAVRGVLRTQLSLNYSDKPIDSLSCT